MFKTTISWMFWIIFHVIIILLIILDLGYLGRRLKEPKFRDALTYVLIWVGIAIIFGIYVLINYGLEEAVIWLTAYIMEYSMSFDNLFVFLVIFSYFAVPFPYQHKTLYIGILSAIVFRALFIFVGIKLLEMFEWMTYVFSAVLIFSGVRLWSGVEEKIEPRENPIVKLASKFLPIHPHYKESRFIVTINGKIMFTPLILALLTIETTDIIFAFDSVPAVVALTMNFFIAYTSNIMAVLGLRSLYFLIASIMFKLKYLNKGLCIILLFLGIKMLIGGLGIKIPIFTSMVVIGTILLIFILLSLVQSKTETTY